MAPSMKLLFENWRKYLIKETSENVVLYDIADPDAAYHENIDPLEGVTIKLPSGEEISFAKIVEDLVGKNLTDPDTGEEFVFDLDAFRSIRARPTPVKSLEEVASNMITVGVGPFYIEQWAMMNGIEAESKSEDPFY